MGKVRFRVMQAPVVHCRARPVCRARGQAWGGMWRRRGTDTVRKPIPAPAVGSGDVMQTGNTTGSRPARPPAARERRRDDGPIMAGRGQRGRDAERARSRPAQPIRQRFRMSYPRARIGGGQGHDGETGRRDLAAQPRSRSNMSRSNRSSSPSKACGRGAGAGVAPRRPPRAGRPRGCRSGRKRGGGESATAWRAFPVGWRRSSPAGRRPCFGPGRSVRLMVRSRRSTASCFVPAEARPHGSVPAEARPHGSVPAEARLMVRSRRSTASSGPGRSVRPAAAITAVRRSIAPRRPPARARRKEPVMVTVAAFARTAALLGDPARAAMLSVLMDGRALTAAELARAAGVTPQTASGHLGQLAEAGLLAVARQAATATTASPPRAWPDAGGRDGGGGGRDAGPACHPPSLRPAGFPPASRPPGRRLARGPDLLRPPRRPSRRRDGGLPGGARRGRARGGWRRAHAAGEAFLRGLGVDLDAARPAGRPASGSFAAPASTGASAGPTSPAPSGRPC